MQTNLTTAVSAQLPAHLAAVIGKGGGVSAAALSGVASSALRLVANQGRWRIKEGSTESVLPTLTLDVIIVGAVPGSTKSYYATAYNASDEKDAKQPDCSSLYGDVPDPGCPSPQASSCAACPQNQWGSKIANGKEVKACSDYRRVALVAASDTDTMYQANIPPASIKFWIKYVKELNMRGLDVSHVITRLSLQDHLWQFERVDYVSAEQFAVTGGLQDTPMMQEVLGTSLRSPVVVTAALRAPTPAPAIAAPAPAPAPVEKAVQANPARGFGKPTPAPAPAMQVVPQPTVEQAAVAAQPAVTVAAPGAGLDSLTAELGALIGGAPDV